jgi:aspartate/tyrosine/aromatic aminotransferase
MMLLLLLLPQMAGMAGRIAGVRGELQAALESRCPDKDWSFITKQIGMFSFTGMNPQQVRHGRSNSYYPVASRSCFVVCLLGVG